MNRPPQTNQRLLIVDDNRAIHDDFRKILVQDHKSSDQFDESSAKLFGTDEPTPKSPSSNSYQIDSAYLGMEGLALVQQAVDKGARYAMVFMDVRMPPGWDGIETTTRLWEVDPDLQVVICTAYSDCSWEDMLAKLGHSDRFVVLKKPFDGIEVLQLANSLSRKWHLLQESKNKMATLEETVLKRTAQVVQEQAKFKTIFENSPEGIFQTSTDGHFLVANSALASIYGYATPKDLIEQMTDIQSQLYVAPNRRLEFQTQMEAESVVRGFESEIKCKDGSSKWISETACRVTKVDGSLLYYQGFVVEITAQKKAEKERDSMETQLRHAQKLEAVGHLAAGIAHEINTPIQYIGDNLHFIEESCSAWGQLFHDYQQLVAAVQTKSVTPELTSALELSSKTMDVDFLNQEIPKSVQQSLKGVATISKIVGAMKEFSHPGTQEKVGVDLNHAIETTLTVSSNQWKYIANVETDFAADLPKVRCHPSEINQVFLNLIVNAAHAIGDVVKSVEGSKGTITISTRQAGPWVDIKIADTGTGIPESAQHRIFEPFFTTKEVGKGTGQGLAIAWSIVVDKHCGQLSFESTVGQGTTFTIRLPSN
jgi:PAS domain S-box-containing protein